MVNGLVIQFNAKFDFYDTITMKPLCKKNRLIQVTKLRFKIMIVFLYFVQGFAIFFLSIYSYLKTDVFDSTSYSMVKVGLVISYSFSTICWVLYILYRNAKYQGTPFTDKRNLSSYTSTNQVIFIIGVGNLANLILHSVTIESKSVIDLVLFSSSAEYLVFFYFAVEEILTEILPFLLIFGQRLLISMVFSSMQARGTVGTILIGDLEIHNDNYSTMSEPSSKFGWINSVASNQSLSRNYTLKDKEFSKLSLQKIEMIEERRFERNQGLGKLSLGTYRSFQVSISII